jgi:hypothetical protein
MMKLLDIAHCARPVLFENASRDYPYSLGGSALGLRNRLRASRHASSLTAGDRMSRLNSLTTSIPLSVGESWHRSRTSHGDKSPPLRL